MLASGIVFFRAYLCAKCKKLYDTVSLYDAHLDSCAGVAAPLDDSHEEHILPTATPDATLDATLVLKVEEDEELEAQPDDELHISDLMQMHQVDVIDDPLMTMHDVEYLDD